ncbi:hypothetical protein LC605_16280 [Nostoc sp. CHAB 5836]|uniref:hypothetical protein n=1 Tax=Nostoc sp. CHAB 5836 TaxID=2780404 RepID=UPI001E30C654|nr:hypothetical protein [Nostoc sp. CHAB 5836]MCC5616600.1 hypothetical protein [Nostoc sp. CHAB 5836]
MSKVIAGKSLNTHYTPVSNALIRNSEIDDGTFRLICWMTSHTEGWEVNFISLQKALGYGRDKLRKILKTAESQNYLVRRKIRTEAGLFDFEYHIFKNTLDAIAFRKSLPQAELTSDLFSGGGATRGVLAGGGSTGGGSTRGGESTPLLEEQYRENQIDSKRLNYFLAMDTPSKQQFLNKFNFAMKNKSEWRSAVSIFDQITGYKVPRTEIDPKAIAREWLSLEETTLFLKPTLT